MWCKLILQMRLLDLGCGFGRNITITSVPASDEVFGVDIALDRLQSAAKKFPSRKFIQARAESLPFPDSAFQSIVCEVAMPYMNIPVALSEINRILEPGGTVHFSLHAFRFTLYELRLAFPTTESLDVSVVGYGQWNDSSLDRKAGRDPWPLRVLSDAPGNVDRNATRRF